MDSTPSDGPDDVWEAAGDAIGRGVEGMVVTIIDARGSIPGVVGAKALVGSSGIQIGNLLEGRGAFGFSRYLDRDEQFVRLNNGLTVSRTWVVSLDMGEVLLDLNHSVHAYLVDY